MSTSKVTIVRPHSVMTVRHPESGMWTTLDPGTPYRSDDPLVKAFPDHFASDADRDVEQATAAPGERRGGRRR